MSYGLLALDMDGTLLTSEKRISPRTREALRRLAESGTPVALCTGRCVRELMDYPSQLPFVRYGVLSSGATVYDFCDRRPLQVHALEPETVLTALRLLEDVPSMVHIMSVTTSVARGDDMRDMGRFGMGIYQSMFEQVCTPVDDIAAWVETHPHEVLKFNFYHQSKADCVHARKVLEQAKLPLELAFAEETSLECSAAGISKATGMRELASFLGLESGLEQVVAIGDSDNDLAVLEAVGMPVAMGNARESVKRCARLVVADNDHDGIAEAVSRLFSLA